MASPLTSAIQKINGVLRIGKVVSAPAKVYPQQSVNVTPVGAGQSGQTEAMYENQMISFTQRKSATPVTQQAQDQAKLAQSADYLSTGGATDLTPSQQAFLAGGDVVPNNAQDIVTYTNYGTTGVGGITHIPNSGQVMLASERASGQRPIGGMLETYNRSPNTGTIQLPSEMIAQPFKLQQSTNPNPSVQATEKLIGNQAIALLQSNDPRGTATALLSSNDPNTRQSAKVALQYLWATQGPGSTLPSLSGVGALVQGALQSIAYTQYQATKKPVQLSMAGLTGQPTIAPNKVVSTPRTVVQQSIPGSNLWDIGVQTPIALVPNSNNVISTIAAPVSSVSMTPMQTLTPITAQKSAQAVLALSAQRNVSINQISAPYVMQSLPIVVRPVAATSTPSYVVSDPMAAIYGAKAPVLAPAPKAASAPSSGLSSLSSHFSSGIFASNWHPGS